MNEASIVSGVSALQGLLKMKSYLCIFVVVVGLLNGISAGDDGKYRPEKYGDRAGAYNPYYNGRYDYRYLNNFGGNGLYYPNYYQHDIRPYQQLTVPLEYSRDNSIIASTTALPTVVVTPAVHPSNYVYARNYGNEGYARIVEQDSNVDNNSYQYKYKTENGISAAESGVVDATGSVGGTRVAGFYEYVGTDGLTYRVDYTADENGFHPTGAHLPKA